MRRRRPSGVNRSVRVHEAHRPLARPVEREQPVHQARVQHVEVARADPPRHAVEDRRGRDPTARSCLVTPRSALRRANSAGIDVDPRSRRSGRRRPGTSAPTPPRDTATTRLGIDVERRLQPVQERHPVQRLEADLRQPRAGDEQPAARDDAPRSRARCPTRCGRTPAAPAAAPAGATPRAAAAARARNGVLGGVDARVAHAPRPPRRTACQRVLDALRPRP